MSSVAWYNPLLTMDDNVSCLSTIDSGYHGYSNIKGLYMHGIQGVALIRVSMDTTVTLTSRDQTR